MRTDSKLWLGINPGLSGRAVLLGPDGVRGWWAPPTTEEAGRRRYHVAGLVELALGWRHLHPGVRLVVALEQQHAAPGVGSIGAWSSGYGYGLWLAALAAAGLEPVEVHPSRWKRALGCVPEGLAQPAEPAADPGQLEGWRAARPQRGASKRALGAWRRSRPQAAPELVAAWREEKKRVKDARRGAGLERMCARAAELFPAEDLRATPRCRKPDHNRAAALLLAVYARDYLTPEVRGG